MEISSKINCFYSLTLYYSPSKAIPQKPLKLPLDSASAHNNKKKQKKSRWKFRNNHINKDIYHARILLREQFTIYNFCCQSFVGEFSVSMASTGRQWREREKKWINCGFSEKLLNSPHCNGWVWIELRFGHCFVWVWLVFVESF